MIEDYRNKHYPSGIFSSVNKSNQKRGIALYVFFGIFLIASGYGTVWAFMRTMKFSKSGESDMVHGGIAITGFFLVVFLISLLTVTITIKRNSLGTEGIIKKSAKKSGYSESEIHEFERQAMASDSYILALTGKIKAVVSGQKDGILTRDYIYLADAKNIVLNCCDIKGAFLVERTIYITVNNVSQPVQYLTITLISHKGIQTLAETSMEAGRALLVMLQEKNPQIDTKNGIVIKEKEYNKYCKEIL